MIHVSKQQLAQVEYLFAQSAQGHHVLFHVDELRRALTRSLSNQEAYESEPHLERLLEEPTLERKRAYLDRLEPQIFARVVQTYFCIIENNLAQASEVRH